MRSFLTDTILALVAIVLVADPAWARNYPTRPIRAVVPQAPGGASDIIMRTIAQKLSVSLGQQVLVDNRPGANSIIGTDLVAKAAPDGYTLLLGASPGLAINPAVYKQLPYDPIQDFAPVTLTGTAFYVIVVHPSVPASSIKEFIALAKSKPGQLNYGAGSSGARIGTELFNQAAGVRLTYIPYRSAPPALADLMAGQLSMILEPVMSATPHIKSGKLRALAVATSARLPQFQDVPTLAESGLQGSELSSWLSIHAPAKTPAEIVNKLNAEIVKIVNMPDVIERFRSLGVEPQTSTPEQLLALNKSDIARYAKVVKDAGIPQE